MPGASKGSFKAGTPKRAPSQKKLSRSAQSSKAPAPTIAKPAAHGGKRALLEGRASLLVKLVTRKESALNLLSLAQIYVDLEKLSKAKEALERCLALDPADALQARCLLAPLLLNLGEQGEAEELLQRWQAADAATAASLGVAGATMLCTRLLLTLAKWEGDDEGEALCQAAFDAAFAHNWHALLLVCAVGSGDSPIPEGLVAELRERRLEALKKEGLKQGAQPWPGAGGVAEAVLLSEAFAGFAGSEEEQEEAWPDLDGAQIWICHKMLEAFTERPRKATPHPSDGRKEVRLFEGKLEELVDEVGDVLLRAEGEGEEGEEGEEEGGREVEEGRGGED